MVANVGSTIGETEGNYETQENVVNDRHIWEDGKKGKWETHVEASETHEGAWTMNEATCETHVGT
jgi:hypothetical protein